VVRKENAPGAPRERVYDAAFSSFNSPMFRHDFLSVRLENARSHQLIENKGPEKKVSSTKATTILKIKPLTKSQWELENGVTKCPAETASKRA
jgi:hypothetical protein